MKIQLFNGLRSLAFLELSAKRNEHGAHSWNFRAKGTNMGRIPGTFGGKERTWGAFLELSAERSEHGAHSRAFRRKGTNTGRIPGTFVGKARTWAAFLELSGERNVESRVVHEHRL